MHPGRVFLAVPFLTEMKAVLDWVSARTTLDMFMFLRLQGIQAELFQVKCAMYAAKKDKFVTNGELPQARTQLLSISACVHACVCVDV